ncbi:MAG: thiaminase II [Gemmataceae bacterium]
MTTRFTDTLRQNLDPVWQALHRHPFTRALGDGRLEPDRFQVWLRQNYLFLIGYARLFSHAAARADRVTMKWMIGMAHGVLHHEMLLHEAYAVEFGLAGDELPAGVKLPTTRAYTDHLLRTASLGSMLELVAALLPCLWSHAELAQRLAPQANVNDNRYARWIDLYSGPVAERNARQGRDLLDRLAAGAGPEPLAAAEDAFAASSRYEWMFLEMCHKGESWPV